MRLALLAPTLALVIGTLQVRPSPPAPEAEQRVREIMRGLPDDSVLRRDLEQGARGDGVRRAWMTEMLNAGVKRADIWVGMEFDNHGRPRKIRISKVQYFTEYESTNTASIDPKLLGAIQSSGLEKELEALALKRATLGIWVDVPRPKPRPFVGGARIVFYDDEWLPNSTRPIYFAGEWRAP
jgi:hypothetical protein